MVVGRNLYEPSNFNVNFNQSSNKCASVGELTVCKVPVRRTYGRTYKYGVARRAPYLQQSKKFTSIIPQHKSTEHNDF